MAASSMDLVFTGNSIGKPPAAKYRGDVIWARRVRAYNAAMELLANKSVIVAGVLVGLFILERLFEFYRDPRYKPSPWLKRRVMLGLPLSTPEGLVRD